jgi:hypothetical protein
MNAILIKSIEKDLGLQIKISNELLSTADNELQFSFSPHQAITFHLYDICLRNDFLPFYDYKTAFYQIIPNFSDSLGSIRSPFITFTNCTIGYDGDFSY